MQVWLVEIDHDYQEEPESQFGGVFHSLRSACEEHNVHTSRLEPIEEGTFTASYRGIDFTFTVHDVKGKEYA
jgi:hypothetical protein